MPYDQGFIRNLALLEEKMYREAWYNTFWGGMSGLVDISKDDNGNPKYKPSGKPIEVLNKALEEGRDNILIPFENALSGAPVFGDTTLKGTGESMTWKWLRSYMNATRKAVAPKEGVMSEHRAKSLNQIAKARPQLSDWFAKWTNQQVYRAFYEGVSQNLSASNANDGLGLYKRYHPNFYVNVAGVLTKVATTEGETPTATELNSAVTAANTNLTPAILLKLRAKCMKLKIPQIVTEQGFKFWLLITHPDSLAYLQSQSSYTAVQNAAYTGKMLDNTQITGLAGYYAGFAIVEDVVGIRGWDNAAGGFFGDDDADPISSMFEPTNFASPIDNHCHVVVGNSAIGRAVGKNYALSEELDDHGAIIEIGGTIIDGFNRADFAAEADSTEESGGLFFKDTTGGVADGIATKNQSSLILMTDPSA